MFELIHHHDFRGYKPFVDQPDIIQNMSIVINAPACDVYYFLERMGGVNGSYSFDSLNMLKNWNNPQNLKLSNINVPLGVGDKIDFFDVVEVERDQRINLEFSNALMKGDNSYYLLPMDDNMTNLINVVEFSFHYKVGHAYWFVVRPLDYLLRRTMLTNIKKLSECKFERTEQ
jgi:Protein of unknown function (DUF2867)